MKKTIKYILIAILCLRGIFVIYLQKQITYDSRKVNILNQRLDLSKSFPNFYYRYIYQSNEDPGYILSGDIFKKYTNYCHKNQKNCIILPHQQTYSDIMWINSIQYIGSVIDILKAPYMYGILDNLTDLSPYWDYPYYFGSLMLPISNDRNVSQERKRESRIQSVKIGNKGNRFTCDEDKISQIKKLSIDDFKSIAFNQKDSTYQNLIDPCQNYRIPNQLGFNYFHYLKQRDKSIQNYKIASFHPDSPSISPSMVSIISSRAGEYITAMKVLFARLQSIQENLNQAQSKDTIKIHEKDLQDTLINTLAEYQIYIIDQANKLAIDDNESYHNFKKLTSNGYTQTTIQNHIQKCRGLKAQNINQINPEDEDQIICFLLNYGIKQNSIIPNSGKLNAAYNLRGGANDFSFRWDKELQTWLIRRFID